jgi:hypothetical protein
MPALKSACRPDSLKWAILALAIASLAIGGTGCANGAQSPGNGTWNPTSMTISFCSDPGPNCAPGSSFSIASLRDLNIVVRWSNVPAGTHTQHLDILEPDGGLYQTFNTGFAIDANSGGSATTTGIVPVAGSWISQRFLSGNWTVQVSLDDQPQGSSIVRLDP